MVFLKTKTEMPKDAFSIIIKRYSEDAINLDEDRILENFEKKGLTEFQELLRELTNLKDI